MDPHSLRRHGKIPRDRAELDALTRKSVKAFRTLIPTLEAYARILTGQNIRVKMHPRENGSTDGKTISMRPPLELGEDVEHDRRLCDKRDAETMLQLCPACRRREMILATIYHEIAHITHGSIRPPSQWEMKRMVEQAIETHSKKNGAEIAARIDALPDELKKSYITLAGAVSSYFAMLVNAVEDLRVNAQMFQARPGTQVMVKADVLGALRDGVEQLDENGEPTIIPWSMYPLDAQLSVGLMAVSIGIEGPWFHQSVMEALEDEMLRRLINRIPKLRSVRGTIDLSYEILVRGRALGFWKEPEEQEPEPEPEPEPEENDEPESGDEEKSDEQPQSGDSDDDDGDDGSSEGIHPDDADGTAPDEPQEPEHGAGDDEDDPSSDPADTDDDAATDDPEPGASSDDESDEPEGSSGDPTDPADEGEGEDSESQNDAAQDAGDEGDSGDEADGGSEDSGSEDGGDVPEASDDSDGDADDSSDGSDVGEHADGDPGDAGGEPSEADDDGDGDSSDATGGDQPGTGTGESGDNDTDDAGLAGDDDGDPGDRKDVSGDGTSGPAGRGQDSDGTIESDTEGELTDGDTEVDSTEDSKDPKEGDTEADRSREDEGADRPEDDSDAGRSESGTPVSDPSGSDADGDDRQDTSDDGDRPEPSEAGTEDDGDGPAEDDGSDGSDESPAEGDDGRVEFDEDADEELQFLQEADVADLAAPQAPRHGTVEDARHALDHLTGHDHAELTFAERADKEALEAAIVDALTTAIVQEISFDTTSQTIRGVRIFRKNSDEWIGTLEGIKGESVKRVSAYTSDPEKIPESVLGPALLRLRRAFSDNATGGKLVNRRSGRVNKKVLGRRAWQNDDRLFQTKRRVEKKDYVVLIGLDISGSTGWSGRIELIKRAARAQAELLERMGIPFLMYAHTGTRSTGVGYMDLAIFDIKTKDQPWDAKARERLASIGSMSANLDGHTLEFYRKRLDEVATRTTQGVLMYYTDGQMPAENFHEELEILQREIGVCKKRGYHLIGVGIQNDDPTNHGLETVRVDTDADILKVVAKLEQHILG